MSEISQKLTVAIKTFERPELVTRAVSSLRLFHPTIQVIVADDSKEPVSFENDSFTKTLHLPQDSGISFGRNRAIEKVKTPYYLLIDDDHFFKADCNLEDLVHILDTTDYDIVGMRMLNYRTQKGYCRGELHYAGIFVKEGDEMVHYVGKNHGFHQGYPIYDIILNCYVARKKKSADIKFDEKIKIGKEHSDFFLEAKQNGVLVTVSKNSYIHHLQTNSPHYFSFRDRGHLYTKYYFKKHNIKSEKSVGVHYSKLDKIKYFPQRIQYLIKNAFVRK